MYFIQWILQIFFSVIFSTSPLLLFFLLLFFLLLFFLLLFFLLPHCYFFPVTFFPTSPLLLFFLLLFFLLLFFLLLFFRYFFSCYFLSYTQWCHMAAFIWVSIGAGNSLLPDGTKPLPELMLTNHQWGLSAFIFRGKILSLSIFSQGKMSW